MVSIEQILAPLSIVKILPVLRAFTLLCLSGLSFPGSAAAAEPSPGAPAAEPPLRWWKGNLHTHTLWSDGDTYPELAVDWYQQQGYHFLAISDHNVLAEGERWIDTAKSRGGTAAFEKYHARFGAQWVETREGGTQVRLKQLAEYRTLFEQPGKFLLIPAEEISANFARAPIHLGAVNLREVIKPLTGTSVLDVMQKNVDAVLEQRKRTRVPMFPHINHPNFHYAISVEDLARVRGEPFFEVYNGHPGVNNLGDADHLSTERMWDIALALRLTELKLPLLYGIATDDTHAYHQIAVGKSNPGQGWVVVRSRRLDPESLIQAMEAGDFYASTGVVLEDLRFDGRTIEIRIAARPGETCTVSFIGTRASPTRPVPGEEVTGITLATSTGPTAAYTLKGDELYVRARVDSSLTKEIPTVAEQAQQQAWTQPFVPSRE